MNSKVLTMKQKPLSSNVPFFVVVLLVTMCHARSWYSPTASIFDSWTNRGNRMPQSQPIEGNLNGFTVANTFDLQKSLSDSRSRRTTCHRHSHCDSYHYCSCHRYCHPEHGSSCRLGRDAIFEEQETRRDSRTLVDCLTFREKKNHQCNSSLDCGCLRQCSCNGYCVASHCTRP